MHWGLRALAVMPTCNEIPRFSRLCFLFIRRAEKLFLFFFLSLSCFNPFQPTVSGCMLIFLSSSMGLQYWPLSTLILSAFFSNFNLRWSISRDGGWFEIVYLFCGGRWMWLLGQYHHCPSSPSSSSSRLWLRLLFFFSSLNRLCIVSLSSSFWVSFLFARRCWKWPGVKMSGRRSRH